MALTPAFINPNQLLAAGGLEGATDVQITAAFWNRLASLIYWIVGSTGVIGCRARSTTAQSIATGTSPINVLLDSEDFDSDPTGTAMHDTVSNTHQITIRTAGVYSLMGHAGWAGAAGGLRNCSFLSNGTSTGVGDQRPGSGSADAIAQTICQHKNCVAGEIISLAVWQNTGSSLNLNNASLSVVKL